MYYSSYESSLTMHPKTDTYLKSDTFDHIIQIETCGIRQKSHLKMKLCVFFLIIMEDIQTKDTFIEVFQCRKVGIYFVIFMIELTNLM